MKLVPYNVLILTGAIGSGHVSVARAISKALYRMNGRRIHVETVDFIETLKNFAATATKKIYLGSLKISPKIYEVLFAESDERKWPLQLLNAVSAPFMQRKFFKLMKKERPDVLISTFPIWNLLIGKIWKKYREFIKIEAPFVSVITDSISIHSAWTMGNPDFFIAPNEDTKISLKHFGIPEHRIKVFGYPVDHRFLKPGLLLDFQRKWDLSPSKKTLLIILGTGIRWSKIKRLISAIKESSLKNCQLVIVATGGKRLQDKLAKIQWPWQTRITGWTKEMHTFIHAADIVLTKAGGSTIMECIHSKKPMVIIDAIPGQEIGNAMLVQKYNLGVVLKEDLSDFDRAIEYIFTHESLLKKNLLSAQKPHAAEDIARFLVSLIARSG